MHNPATRNRQGVDIGDQYRSAIYYHTPEQQAAALASRERTQAAHRQAGKFTYIGIRHEGAAAFAASAYGELTGRPAACLTIAGPGATNLLTGLWDATSTARRCWP